SRSFGAVSTSALTLLSFRPSVPHLDVHSFPTRRSSDLKTLIFGAIKSGETANMQLYSGNGMSITAVSMNPYPDQNGAIPINNYRSEEHTSALQSRENLVCRLLPEKKKVAAQLVDAATMA